MAQYARVLRQRKTVIAEARDQKCTACFVMLRPQNWEEIRTNEQILTCSSCGRLFYYDPASEPAAPPEAPPKKKSQTAAKNDAQGATETTADAQPTSAPYRNCL